METEKRFYEIRAVSGRRLEGTAIRYGDTALVKNIGPERFLVGAFGDLREADCILNVQHDRGRPIARTGGGGLTLADSPEALQLIADLPTVNEANDALELVRTKVLRGFSVEFRALKETFEGGVRTIESAELLAIGLVDRPAYGGSTVQARAAIPGVEIGFEIPLDKKLQCECHKGDCDFVRFSELAFSASLDDKTGDVIVIIGDYKGVISSRKRGSLILTQEKGKLVGTTTLADTQASRDLIAQAGESPLIARPVFGKPMAFKEADGVATYSEARLRAITIGATDKSEGWPEIQLKQKGGKKGRRWWL